MKIKFSDWSLSPNFITVLQSSSGVSRTLHSDHDESHEEEEESYNEADSVDRKVSHRIFAFDFYIGDTNISHRGEEAGPGRFGLLTERDLGEPVLNPRGKHEAGQDDGDEEEEAVHDPGARGVLTAGTKGAASSAGRGGEAAGQAGEADDPSHLLSDSVLVLDFYL